MVCGYMPSALCSLHALWLFPERLSAFLKHLPAGGCFASSRMTSMLLREALWRTLPVGVFPFKNHFKIFLLLLGLWGCGQRAALSKRLWSTRRVVHQVRQIHSPVVAVLEEAGREQHGGRYSQGS